jgi:hypothetical protein
MTTSTTPDRGDGYHCGHCPGAAGRMHAGPDCRFYDNCGCDACPPCPACGGDSRGRSHPEAKPANAPKATFPRWNADESWWYCCYGSVINPGHHGRCSECGGDRPRRAREPLYGLWLSHWAWKCPGACEGRAGCAPLEPKCSVCSAVRPHEDDRPPADPPAPATCALIAGIPAHVAVAALEAAMHGAEVSARRFGYATVRLYVVQSGNHHAIEWLCGAAGLKRTEIDSNATPPTWPAPPARVVWTWTGRWERP